jgi:predicted flap endonuclease-1-like 5' DNA nuclease
MVAVILFIITGIAAFTLAELERNLWTITTAVLGLLFIGLGYSQRPKLQAKTIEAPSPAPTPLSPPPAPVQTATEIVVEEKTETALESAPSIMELTEVKGIGQKRADQLKALGINNVKDLAKASEGDLAAKLKISPKITGKWIENAKNLVEKS